MIKDLTTGNPKKVLWKFTLPLFGSIVFQQLYNIADSFVAGRWISADALAAVGNSYEITLIFIAFAFGCNIGSSVVISQLFGAKKHREMKTAVSTTCIACGVLCVTLMILGFFLTPTLLNLINTPQNIFDDSMLYLNIYIGGLLFLFFYNIATGIFSALGDSRTPFFFLAVSSVSNIFLDIFFVRSLQMGISGVAWATFICQGVSCICAMLALFLRLRKIETAEKAPVFSFIMLKKITTIAVPSILQQSFVSVGNIIVQSIVNGYGSEVVAGYSAAIKLNSFAIAAFCAQGNGMSSFAAQNVGARKPDRIKSGFRGGLIMVYALSLAFAAIFVFCGGNLIDMFMNEETRSQKALETGAQFLIFVSPCYIMVATKLMADAVLRGTASMKMFMISTFTDLGLRVVFALILSPLLGVTGIWMSWPIGWAVSTVLSIVFYKKCMSKVFSPQYLNVSDR